MGLLPGTTVGMGATDEGEGEAVGSGNMSDFLSMSSNWSTSMMAAFVFWWSFWGTLAADLCAEGKADEVDSWNGRRWSETRRRYKEEKLGSYAVTCWSCGQELYRRRIETS